MQQKHKKKMFFYDYISQQSVQASRHQPQTETGEHIGDKINLYELLHNMVDTGATSCRLVSQLANQLSRLLALSEDGSHDLFKQKF